MDKIITNLLQKYTKTMKINEKFLVKRIELRNELDQIRLDLQQKNIEYKGLVMDKGDTFPIPMLNDILSVEKIYFKYSQQFQYKLYIKGKVDNENEKPKFDNEIIKYYSFEYSDIFDTLSTFTKTIVFKNNSSIFRIMDIYLMNDNYKAKIKDISNSKVYQLNLNREQFGIFKIDDFLWIYNYELNKDVCLGNTLTIFEILNEEKLINLLDCYFYNENISLFEVIDIDDDKIILIDTREKIYEINNFQNYIKSYQIKFCSLLIIANYIIQKNDKIELTEHSFIYKFDDNSYYLQNIEINSYAVIKLIFLDYIKDNNKFNKISYEFGEKEIENETEYVIISSLIDKKYDYYPFELTLSNSDENKNIIPITFTIYLYQSLLIKINTFLNTNSPKTYFYEFFYYNINDNLGTIEKKISINNKEYNINTSDSFGSLNRKRISIMNIPYQEIEVEEEDLTENSIQICELIKGNIHKIIGIYNIIPFKINNEQSSDYLDIFYQSVGDIYDMLINYDIKDYNKIENSLFKKLNFINFQKIKEMDGIDLLKINSFENKMTLSQFKTRVGLIICLYLNNNMKNHTIIIKIIKEAADILFQIKEEKFEYNEIIRILLFTLEEKITKNSSNNLELKVVSKLNPNSPYAIAYNFNKEQINNLNEFNALFQAYLQLDSYQSYNYIFSRITHNFSLEMIFMLKYQLLSTYDKFFYIKRKKGDEFAYLDSKTKITVINEYTSFGKTFKEDEIVKDTKDTKRIKDYAMPLSLHFMHENGGHNKFDLKNDDYYPSSVFFRGLNIEIEVFYNSFKDGIMFGESGIMIEKFISTDKHIIHILSTKFIFGEFLSEEYFNQKDFKKLINDVKQKIRALNVEKDDEKENDEIQISNQSQKNYIIDKKVEESNENISYIQVGDMFLDINNLKRNALISNQEHKLLFKEYLSKRKKKLDSLRKIKEESKLKKNKINFNV